MQTRFAGGDARAPALGGDEGEDGGEEHEGEEEGGYALGSACCDSRGNMLYLAARTPNRAIVCLHVAQIAALWSSGPTGYRGTETPFLLLNNPYRSFCTFASNRRNSRI